MQDRPTFGELLGAISQLLSEDHLHRTEGVERYKLRIAINLLAILGREQEMEPENLTRERRGLAELMNHPVADGVEPEGAGANAELVRQGNESLCEEIRAGAFDAASRSDPLLRHMVEVTEAKLRIANPRFLERVGRS